MTGERGRHLCSRGGFGLPNRVKMADWKQLSLRRQCSPGTKVKQSDSTTIHEQLFSHHGYLTNAIRAQDATVYVQLGPVARGWELTMQQLSTGPTHNDEYSQHTGNGFEPYVETTGHLYLELLLLLRINVDGLLADQC